MRGAATLAAPPAARLPWYVAATLVAATSAKVGIIWDISWHRSIGRDTFWTPAHAAIYLGDSARQSVSRAVAPEPQPGAAGPTTVRPARRLRGRHSAPERRDDRHRASRFPQRGPQRRLLSGGRRRAADPASRGRAGGPAPLARYDRRPRLHGVLARHDLDPAARAGHAEARPGVQSCDPHGTAAVPVAARGAGGGDRPVDAARRPGPRLAVGGAGRARLPRGVLRDPVVLHRVSAQSAQPHLSVRRRSLGLFEPPGAVALPLLARRDRSGDAARAGDRRGAGRGL